MPATMLGDGPVLDDCGDFSSGSSSTNVSRCMANTLPVNRTEGSCMRANAPGL